MALINTAVTRSFDLFFAMFAPAGAWAGMVAVSLLTALLALVIFRYTSSQSGIRAVKDRLISHLLEVVLYRDELRVVLRAQVAILRDDVKYLGYALVPLAFMIVPVGVLLIQTDLRYGHRPLALGEQVIVGVKLRSAGGNLSRVSLSASDGAEVETPPLTMPAIGEVDWRVRGVTAGDHELRFSVNGREFSKRIAIGERASRIAVLRVGGGAWQQFLHPGEPPLPADGPVEWIQVSYPGREMRALGWRMHWVWPWLVLTLALGYILKGPLRVQV
jgi:hypothetical protein